ncbi:MAG: molybdopterin-synthase adenylyltransferase MoeB [Chthoniobacterales bacterium]
MTFTPEELTRYSRHFLLPGVGKEGQQKLKKRSVLCVGLGGLGSPAALYLAAAGIGRLGLVDDDHVDLSNLHRQLLYGTADGNQQKVESARKRLHDLNPNVQLDLYDVRLAVENAMALMAPYDLIIDGSDNFSTRYLVNDAAFFLRKPLVYGALFQFEGYCTLFNTAQGGPCYRCLFPESPGANVIPNCSEAGVLGVLPGIIGTLQATEALKWMLNMGASLQGRLLHVNALTMKFQEFQLRQDPRCPLCGKKPTITKLIDINPPCSLSASMSTTPTTLPSITVEELQAKLQGTTPIQLIDVREPVEYDICHIPGAQLIPLETLPNRIAEFDKDQEIYLQCRSGGRSANAVQLLQQAGFSKVFNVEGGILAWAERIDPTVQKY